MTSLIMVLISILGILTQVSELLDSSMGDDNSVSWGIVILLIVVIFREIREVIRGFHNDTQQEKLAKQISDLHAWHNVNDQDGNKIWYFKSTLKESITDLTKAINKFTNNLNN